MFNSEIDRSRELIDISIILILLKMFFPMQKLIEDEEKNKIIKNEMKKNEIKNKIIRDKRYKKNNNKNNNEEKEISNELKELFNLLPKYCDWSKNFDVDYLECIDKVFDDYISAYKWQFDLDKSLCSISFVFFIFYF